MAQEKEKKYPAMTGENSGQLNADDFPVLVGQNQWVNAVNVRTGSTDKGYTGILESIGGTLRLSELSPSVSFLDIGNISDETGRRIIYFYYNENTSQHKIEVYDFDSDSILLALLDSQVTGGLGFSKDYLIHGYVINGVAYWTDNYNPPRKLNIDAAIKMNNPSYNTTQSPYTNPLESDVITVIRKPPAYALFVNKVTNSVTVNNVADFAGQFAWRYTFRDNEISVMSPPSALVNYNAVGDTYDAVAVVAIDQYGNPSDQISQDVQTVDFCVRYAGQTRYFIIRTWDKRIAADAADIAAHNAGINPLDYTFLNDITGIPLDDAYSVKPYDSVPLLTKTIAPGLNRNLFGNNVEGFNTPVLSSLTGSFVTETNHTPFQNPAFKSASPYQLGIIFKDRYKRVIGNVVTSDALRLQTPERNYLLTSYPHYVAWTLSNAAAADEIPIEAYYYEIVMTKNLRTRFFAQSKSGGMKYAIKDPITGIITYQDTYVATAFGLAFNASLLTAEGKGYSFDPESLDIIKVYLESSSTVYSLSVIAQDGNYIISKLQDLGSFATQPNILFEIYTPYKESRSEPYYTVGSTWVITNPEQSGRIYSSLGGNIYGDVYNFGAFAPTGTYYIENMSPNVKYWKEWNTNSGDFNLVLRSNQVRKVTAVRWSNVIVQGSQNNGLSTFDALDEKILPLDLGNLQKLQNTSKVEEQGNIMLAIGEQETASLYLGEVQLVGSESNAFVAQAANVIGTVNVLKGSFGTVNAESVTEYRGNVYWFDANNGRYIQYSANGLFPISNFKMTRFWKLWSEQYLSMTAAEIEAFGGRPFVFSIVDPFHDELLISLPKLMSESPKGTLPRFTSDIDAETQMTYPFDILDFQGKTMVYDLNTSSWMGSFSFYAEGFSTLQNQLYSFRNGQMYLHNQYDNQCNFYGTQYKAKIMVVSNANPTTPKSYNAIAIEGNTVPTYTYLYNDYPYQQLTDLADYQYRSLEGVWNATIQRNIIQPTATGNTVDSRLTGEKMRGIYMWVMFEFSPTGSSPMQLRFINLAFSLSFGNVNT